MSPIANMLTQLKNAQAVFKESVAVPSSELRLKIAEILKHNNFIEDFAVKKGKVKKTEHDYLTLTLKYDNGRGVITGARLISRPSRRVYVSSRQIRPVKNGVGVAVISTPQGLLTNKEARKNKVGGEILFEIW